MDLIFDPLIQARITGTLGGAIMVWATGRARTKGGFVKRIITSIICGLFFAEVPADWMGWSVESPRRMLAASCAAAFMGWWVAHALIRSIDSGRLPIPWGRRE